MIELDAYERTARLAPAYLVFSPVVVLITVAALGSDELWAKIGGVLVACGGPLLAAEWGRGGGAKKQAALFAAWGGAPTTSLLRFSTGGSVAAVAQRHAEVERTTRIALPSQSDEDADRQAADDVYEAVVEKLRALTREEKSPLLLKQNTRYGFRRNLWGRKPWGIGISIGVIVVSAALLLAALLDDEFAGIGAVSAGIAIAFALFALVLWISMVTPDWVRDAGDSYARALLDAVMRLPDAA